MSEQRIKNGVDGIVSITFRDGKPEGFRFVLPLVDQLVGDSLFGMEYVKFLTIKWCDVE